MSNCVKFGRFPAIHSWDQFSSGNENVWETDNSLKNKFVQKRRMQLSNCDFTDFVTEFLHTALTSRSVWDWTWRKDQLVLSKGQLSFKCTYQLHAPRYPPPPPPPPRRWWGFDHGGGQMYPKSPPGDWRNGQISPPFTRGNHSAHWRRSMCPTRVTHLVVKFPTLGQSEAVKSPVVSCGGGGGGWGGLAIDRCIIVCERIGLSNLSAKYWKFPLDLFHSKVNFTFLFVRVLCHKTDNVSCFLAPQGRLLEINFHFFQFMPSRDWLD